jgi:hypothetical protein
MRIIGSIALGFVVVIASLLCLLSSICAVSSGLNSMDRFSSGERLSFAFCALVSLAIAVGAVMLIGKLNRKT